MITPDTKESQALSLFLKPKKVNTINKKTAYELQFEACPPLIKKFLLYNSTIQGKSYQTVKTYYYDIKSFLIFLIKFKGLSPTDSDNPDLSLVTVEFLNNISDQDIYEYLYYCQKDLHSSPATRSKHVSAIREYFNYLYKHERIIDANPAEDIQKPKLAKRLPKYLTEEQTYQLLKAVDGPYKERDYCIMVIFLNCGLRISELVGLNYSDIKKNNTMVIHGKGNKERSLYLNEACKRTLEQYKAVRPVDGVKDKDALFLSRQGNRIHPDTVRYIIEKALKKSGLSGLGITCHKLRHTAATLMYKKGVDIRTLQEILGHESLDTTRIYTHISNEQMKKALEKNSIG